ncbi:MAG TPA: sodium/proline symporter PutP [bacterium]|nr:sodium/proline symporter PutP [bacterium]HPN43459.1 sodium/proline symporter PutP [bacterium]
MTAENQGILVTFFIYLAGMLFIGWFYYSRTKNIADYVLGGRRLNTWVTSLSAQASDMSGWLLLGLPGFAYLYGSQACWMAGGLALGTYLNWKFIAKRLRKYTETAANSITLPTFLENRFRMRTPWIRLIPAFFILVFFLIYTASGFVAGAKLFQTVFGLSYLFALLISIFVIISYTFLGGFMAVCWTDFIQGSIMFISVLVLPILAMHAIQQQGGSISALSSELPGYFNPFTTPAGESLSIITIISLLAWGLGYFGQPHILARFMAIRHHRQIPIARRIAMVWVSLSLTGAVLIGISGRAYLPLLLNSTTSETIFMHLVNALTHTYLAGFLLSAVLAAIMSTADSQLLVASSAVTEDIYRLLFHKNADERELVWISRIAVLAIAALAFLIALDPESSVLDLVSYAWAGFGASFGPVVLFSLFWKRMTGRGALAGLAAGGITVLIWKHLHGGWFDVYEIVPGFILSSATLVITSLLDRPPSAVMIMEYDKVTSHEED